MNTPIRHLRTASALWAITLHCLVAAPEPVPVGGGSYASEPSETDLQIKENGQPPLATLLGNDPLIAPEMKSQPTPTNKWWTDLLRGNFPGQLWAHPLMFEGEKNGSGYKVSIPGDWNKDGTARVMDPPLGIQPTAGGTPIVMTAKSHLVTGWGDWHVRWKHNLGEGKSIEVTLARGMPYVWLDCKGVGANIPILPDDVLSDASGKVLTGPTTTDTVLISRAGRRFALFCHPPATVTPGTVLQLNWAGTDHILVVSGIPGDAPVATFREHAFAIPTATELSWNYEPAAGRVHTTWTITARNADGGKEEPLQGWLPHQWRDTTHQVPFLPGHDFKTLLGSVRFAIGKTFAFDWEFTGLLPTLPLTEGADTARRERMTSAIQALTTSKAKTPDKKRLGNDTYWGGKQLLYSSQSLLLARQLAGQDAPLTQDLQKILREALEDWFTYTPGEESRYFASYNSRFPQWPALVGFRPSYGSSTFNDHHFHYGYFTLASALLGVSDPEFLQKYGEMARLVAKDYANWDRKDTRFPVLRCFDPWSGHSYAGGFGSGGGNNQESSSEAMQSWGGLFLLGSVLGDADMTATGAMGYAIESRSSAAYFNDYHGWKYGPEASTTSPNYPLPVTGILWDGRRTNGLYWWGPRPIFIFAIQWLPNSPVMQYLGRDPEYVKWLNKELLERTEAYWPKRRKETKAPEDKPYPGWREDFGGDWGDVYLGFLLYGDPGAVIDELDKAFADKTDYAKQDCVSYTYAHAIARKDLGPVEWSAWTDMPTSTVFRGANNTLTAVVYNPQATAKEVQIYSGGKVVDKFTVPPHEIKTKTAAKAP